MNAISEERLHDLRSLPLGFRLKRLRSHFAYTQEEFAKMVGSTQSTVSQWEKGVNVPRGKFLERIVELYNLPYDFFMDIDSGTTERKDADLCG